MQTTATLLYVLTLSLGFALAPAPARASGSVAVTVASAHHDLTIKQTFRKILARGQSAGYHDSVRKDFLAISARLTPLLDKLLARAARRDTKRLPGLDLAALWERHCQAVATYALKAIKDEAALEALRRSLRDALVAAISPSR